MEKPPFVHLHNHTTYSLRDGLQKLDRMCAAAAADGQPAVAITDHGNLAGGWRLAKAAADSGIKAIMGAEVYLAYGSRFEHATGDGLDDSGRRGKSKTNQHLTVLCQTAEGWRNLTTMMHRAYESYWHKPRIDLDLLAEHSRGLIVLTGCLGGPVAGPLAVDDEQTAEANLERLVEIMGRDHVAVEVMSHGIPTEDRILPDLARLAKRYRLDLVATNDAHYTSADEAITHRAWLCSGQPGVTLRSPAPPRWEFPGHGYHLRTTAEMRQIFDGESATESAVTNAYRIAESIEDTVIPERKSRLPRTPVPARLQTSAGALWEIVRSGAVERYGQPPPAHVQERLRYEMKVIAGAGLADYFLVVSDLLRFATARGIRTSVRGSALGCVVAYCSGITSIDPLEYDLLFERFLNPERAGMPDIDVDVERDRQAELIQYLGEKWGESNVARLGTIGVEKSRSAIRAVGRVLGERELADDLSRLVPLGPGNVPLSLDVLMGDGAPAAAEPFRSKVDSSPGATRLVDMAKSFAGVASIEGVHACGVVVSSESLVGLVPLRRHLQSGQTITSWDAHDIEDVGLLKLDLLRLRTLDIISHTVRLIQESTGELVEFSHSDPQREAAAWDLIARGETAGLFQLDGQGMTQLLVDVQPRTVSDLAVVIALYRPGPLGQGLHERYAARRHGRENTDYSYLTSVPAEVSVLEGALADTHGLPIYQEQIMALGRAVAGFGPGTSNRLQKAVSKKDALEMAEIGRLFITGAMASVAETGSAKQPFAEATAKRVWATVQAAGSYAFNKSHAVGYATVSWITAYLAANWPAAYGAALLADTDRADKRFSALRSLVDRGIKVLPPSVNSGGIATATEGDSTIRLGMSEVMGVATKAALVVQARSEGGPFVSLGDFVTRSGLPVNAIEAMIQAGATDEFGPRLGQMMVCRALKTTPDLAVPRVEWGVVERAARERSMLGVLLSPHPLLYAKDRIRTWRHAYDRLSLHGDFRPGYRYTVVGVVSSIEVIQQTYRLARLTLEGTKATQECVIWGDLLDRLRAESRLPEVGQVVQVDVSAKVRLVEHRVSDDETDDSGEPGGAVSEPQVTLTVLRVYTADEVQP